MSKIIVRGKPLQRGRTVLISPKNSVLTALAYGRIVLDQKRPSVSVASKNRELALICLKGEGEIIFGNIHHRVKPYDALFIPPRLTGEVSTDSAVDFAECSAPSRQSGEPIFVGFESVKNNTALSGTLGKQASTRRIYKLIDSNVPASRLLCGLVFGMPGNWTSWPPHEHAKQKEEIYLYISMPKPAFGVQMVYRDLKKVDFVGPVFENDAVIIKRGFHPNVGIPGYGINFLWMMATLSPSMKRSWADMHFQKEFDGKY
jgi:5-deoxy-glucuronate isomerase